MTYQISITEEVANVAVTSNSYPIIIEYNAVIEQAGGNTTYGDSNVRTFLASGTNTGNIISTANIAGAFILGNGSQLTGIAATYGNANVAANLAAFGTNPISTSGNITGGYILGNGSQLTGLPATYGNANVAANLAAFGSNPISTTGNITAGYIVGNGSLLTNITAGNITGTVANATYALNANAATYATNAIQANVANVANAVAGANVSGTVANATYALNSNAATFAGTVTTAAQPNITSVGILTAVNTSGAISATGNITAGNLQINTDAVITGNLTVNGTTTTINSNVVTVNDKTFVLANNQSTSAGVDGSGIIAGNPAVASILYSNANTAWETNIGVRVSGAVSALGNITGGNLITTGVVYTPQVEAAGDLDLNTAGKVNINGNIRVGDNNTNTEIATHGTGDLTLRTNSGSVTEGSITLFDGASGNIDIATNGTGTVNIAAPVSATGNITGNYFIGNGSQLTGIAASYGDSNVSTLLAAFGSNTVSTTGNVTSGNLITTGIVTATGNINGANLVASANLTSTQQTVVGTANTGTTGNIVVSGRNIATDMAYSPDGATGVNLYTGRVMVGTGWAGNNAVGIGSRLTTMDMINRGNTATQLRQLESEVLVNLTANVSNPSFRQQAIGGRIRIGGGSAANVTALTSAFGVPFALAAAQNNLEIGNGSPYFLGNTTLSHATLNSGAITLNGGSSIGNAYGYVPGVVGSGFSANITNYIGVASSFTGANVTGNLFCFYNGNATSLGAYAIQTANTARAAANYYFLRNDDDVAQVKLGSLRSYNEFQYATATSGTVNIDKTNAQVQFIAPTGNITIGDYQNFVSTANDGTNNDTQTDTVTLIIQQGATPYTVTMPTGNASIKYAGGISTVGSTANSVTMVNITAIRSAANAAVYLATVSSEFV